MDNRALKRFSTGLGPILAFVLLLLVSLVLMSNATQGSARFDQLYSVLLVINALGLIALGGLIASNLFTLLRQVRRGQPGARLTVRMVAVFVILSVTPVLVVYYFSLQFLHRGIDSWFDVRIERALDDALELSRSALGVRMRELLSQTEVVADNLVDIPDDQIAIGLDDNRRLSGASEFTLIGANGHIIASSSRDPTAIVPHRPSDAILMQLRQSGSYIGLDSVGDAGLNVRVVVRLPASLPTMEPRILQALYPVAERTSALAETVQSTYAKYRELAYLRKPLKTSFTLTLSLVLLLSLFAAVWAAFYSARRMVAPLQDLAQGTRAVADGDYETQLPESGEDEVGFLVESFNDMTRRLARARDETRRSQQQVEDQRRYLETVLSQLSTGVLTLDENGRLFTGNKAASQILHVELNGESGKTLAEISHLHPHLHPLEHALQARVVKTSPTSTPGDDWREEIILLGPSGRQILTCSSTPLSASGGFFAGRVIVFDDVTDLIQAQRNAAWSEVARRLAHEIKNPLTPIQLSAERLRHKYLGKMKAEDSDALDRLTRTIVQQVEAMKAMVNAFSDYARAPRMQLRDVDVNELITDVVELYRAGNSEIDIETVLADNLPPLEADADRLRQILHNLIKNALEASPSDGAARVRIETLFVKGPSQDLIEIRIRDFGRGLPENMAEDIFDPHVTTKTKGGGLGLAIVKKIVEEHGGVVWAENKTQGASVIMQFPVVSGDSLSAPATRRQAI
ncbi:MAG: HAMP domain-containing protein [Gammaproteobacteria bacterium]|nr:HAMP domain-containing protein [Gammaproteobacteria bacterium]